MLADEGAADSGAGGVRCRPGIVSHLDLGIVQPKGMVRR